MGHLLLEGGIEQQTLNLLLGNQETESAIGKEALKNKFGIILDSSNEV